MSHLVQLSVDVGEALSAQRTLPYLCLKKKGGKGEKGISPWMLNATYFNFFACLESLLHCPILFPLYHLIYSACFVCVKGLMPFFHSPHLSFLSTGRVLSSLSLPLSPPICNCTHGDLTITSFFKASS